MGDPPARLLEGALRFRAGIPPDRLATFLTERAKAPAHAHTSRQPGARYQSFSSFATPRSTGTGYSPEKQAWQYRSRSSCALSTASIMLSTER